eukprot:384889-Pyramimonas_sp.AAC.1
MGGTGPIRSPGQPVAVHPPVPEERRATLAPLRYGRAGAGTAVRAAAQRCAPLYAVPVRDPRSRETAARARGDLLSWSAAFSCAGAFQNCCGRDQTARE